MNGLLVTALIALGVVVAFDKFKAGGSGMPQLRRGV